jgi:hypothetical protein
MCTVHTQQLNLLLRYFFWSSNQAQLAWEMEVVQHLRNVCELLPDYKASHTRSQSQSPLQQYCKQSVMTGLSGAQTVNN